MTRGTRFAVLLVALSVVAAAAFAGGVTAAEDASVTAEPTASGATVTHTVTVTVGETAAGAWNGITVNYTGSGADAGDVTRADLQRVGVDAGDDGTGDAIDREVGMGVQSVRASDDGAVLTVTLDGSATVEAGDELVLVYGNVTNPMAGEWAVGVDVNPDESGGTTTATLATGDASMGDETMSDDSMGDETMSGNDSMDDGDSTNNETMDDGDSTNDSAGADGSGDEDSPSPTASGGQPGFGLAVAAVGLLAGALLALRRGA
jgi:hypothetical protein